jgi:hypothetical protein
MKSVIRTPCWFTAEIIGADEFDEAKPHTWDRWSLSNIIFENVTASRGNTADAAGPTVSDSCIQYLAQGVTASREVRSRRGPLGEARSDPCICW